MIKLIVALGENNLLGKDNKMAWNIPSEFKHFRNTTLSHSLFMGGNTFKNLPSKLEGRTHYIFDFNDIEGADYMIRSEEEAINLFNKFKDSDQILFIVGGKLVYEKFYKWADELIVSYIKISASGNIYLNWDLSNYSKELIFSNDEFDVYKYRKK